MDSLLNDLDAGARSAPKASPPTVTRQPTPAAAPVRSAAPAPKPVVAVDDLDDLLEVCVMLTYVATVLRLTLIGVRVWMHRHLEEELPLHLEEGAEERLLVVAMM